MSPYAILRFRVGEGHSVWLTDYFTEKEAKEAARLQEAGYPGGGFQSLFGSSFFEYDTDGTGGTEGVVYSS